MAPVDTRNPRATAVRKKTWQPPNLLPDPNPSDEWDYHWVRVATLGDPDIPNVSVRQREGWIPVRPEEVPEVRTQVAGLDNKGNDKGIVEVGGLMLCKMPKEMAQARSDYYADQARKQEESVDQNLMRESNPRMPISRPEKSTRVSFGRGTRESE